ncbi:hypothetical protein FHS29_002849 [Saccharothrix tamanrassetensis]|uniref:Chaplin domain-containing protein n=1 Tax=Saccharothrix tamanrassetensis TaxID=1051531 RepID=A0A841CGZ4_9PSEU|nr:hypothetical protein [Saccharothrix tamanrassetensis]MBB5956263.1 hypothetical protein [Saccharothrix tamanrassetensis]
MLKKAGAVAAIAAGFMMLGSPAFAVTGEPGDAGHANDGHDGPHWTNGPIVSALNGNNVNAVVGACGNNVGVLGAAVPINSPVFIDNCAAGGIVDGDDVNVNG